MLTFDAIGLLIAVAHLLFAFIVAASLPQASRRGGAAAGTIYLILAFATIIWITRQVLWQL